MKRIYPGAAMLALETGASLLAFRVTGVWPFDHVNIWKGLLKRCRAMLSFGSVHLLEMSGETRKAKIRDGVNQIKASLHALR